MDITVKGLSGRLYLERGEFRLDSEFAVPGLGVTGILGPSGSGKTTLLRCIAGLDRAPNGRITFGDATWQDESQDLFVPPHRRAIGFVFQDSALFPHLTVRPNLEYGWRRVPQSARTIPFDQVIELLGLTSFLDRGVAHLSGGERQRVAIGRALLTSPELLLLDEPLASLDMDAKAEILPYLERLHGELAMPVLYVSHQQDEVARLADHLLLLENGRMIAAGPLGEVLTRLDLPLAQRDTAESVLEATVESHDDRWELSYLEFPGGRLSVARQPLAVGAKVRVRIAARDVSLTLEQPERTSILNIFPAQVAEISALRGGGPHLTVRVEVGSQSLLARITRKSGDLLALTPGKQVYAQVKGVAVLR